MVDPFRLLWPPDGVLAAIAAENNLAEAAFVVRRSEVSPLRWFTPRVEVDFCGHATLAVAARRAVNKLSNDLLPLSVGRNCAGNVP